MKQFITTYSKHLIGILVLGIALTGVIFATGMSREDFIMSFHSGFLRADWHNDHTHDGVFFYGYGFSGAQQQWGYGYGYSDKDADSRQSENLNNYGFIGNDGAARFDSIVTTQTTAKIVYSTPYLARFAWAYALSTPITGDNFLGGDDNATDYFSGPQTVSLDKLKCGTTYYFNVNARDVEHNRWSANTSFVTQSCSTGQSSGSYRSATPTSKPFEKPVLPKGTQLLLGSQNPEVFTLQQILNKLGFVVSANGAGSPGHETSFFGPKTKAALKKFQIAHGLNPDGIYGSITQQVIVGLIK